jgi:hypothetical protein
MTTDNFVPKKALQVTRMIHLSLLTGSLAYIILVFNIFRDSFIIKLDLSDPLLLSLIILCCVAIPSGYLYSKKTFNKTEPGDLLRQKYPIYQSGLIIRLATCEGVALFAVVCLQLTSNLLCIIFFFIALIVMIGFYPTPYKIGKEIKLTQSEIEQFY